MAVDSAGHAIEPDQLDGRSIAIAGGGLVGVSWGALFTHHGARVMLWDPASEARDLAIRRFGNATEQLAEICPPNSSGTFDITDSLDEALEGAELVQENAPESIEVKRSLYREIEDVIPETTILASSTSALTWSDLSPSLRVPERFVTAHPFNPPHLVPLVELYGIDSSVLERAEAMYRAADRVPIRLRKDATGQFEQGVLGTLNHLLFDRLWRARHSHLGCVDFGHRGLGVKLLHVTHASIFLPGGLVCDESCRIELRRRVGEQKADCLMFVELAAEGFALGAPRLHFLHQTLAGAKTSRGDVQPFLAKPCLADRVGFAESA